ncbi:hypothetical protein VTK73DRAFT_4058 [Phialemonium thermophilum]|uniref:Uncharacterized protein n=1 Tax=Phialemonium thermophilum TaxID=223376 RepID=A0ABR3WVF6_9PEZI
MVQEGLRVVSAEQLLPLRDGLLVLDVLHVVVPSLPPELLDHAPRLVDHAEPRSVARHRLGYRVVPPVQPIDDVVREPHRPAGQVHVERIRVPQAPLLVRDAFLPARERRLRLRTHDVQLADLRVEQAQHVSVDHLPDPAQQHRRVEAPGLAAFRDPELEETRPRIHYEPELREPGQRLLEAVQEHVPRLAGPARQRLPGQGTIEIVVTEKRRIIKHLVRQPASVHVEPQLFHAAKRLVREQGLLFQRPQSLCQPRGHQCLHVKQRLGVAVQAS